MELCRYQVLLLPLTLLWAGGITAQAPGDEDARCTTEHDNPPQYPDTVRPLMDSYHYTNLLPGNGTGNPLIANTAWTDFSFDMNDVDGETATSTYWQQGAGGVCRFQVRVCGWQREGTAQNNWLFTQHISQAFDPNEYPNTTVRIKVEITYGVMNCRGDCIKGFNLLHYMTDETQLSSTEGKGFMNPSNYVQFASPRAPPSPLTTNRTFTFTLPPSSTGFYLAAQDTGSCLAISRMRVYRNNCKLRTIGLTTYPEAPASASPIVSCALHSSPIGGEMAMCLSNGTWGPETPECKCDCGYENIRDTCTPCQPHFFKACGMDECAPCPANSDSESEAACICQCFPHYYRVDNETKSGPYMSPVENATHGCTKAPNTPNSVTVEVTNTSVTVSWEPPSSNGGRADDVFYRVSFCQVLHCDEAHYQHSSCEVPKCGDESQKLEEIIYDTTLRYVFFTEPKDLIPVTLYQVTVQAENGVSYLDDRVELRRVVLEVTTAEGCPEEVSNPKAVDNIVLVWGPPKVPNGNITGYRIWLEFCATGEEGSGGMGSNGTDLLVPETEEGKCENTTNIVDADTLFFVLNNDVLPDYPHNLTYRICAQTRACSCGWWSAEETIEPGFSCPRLPPTMPPTPPITCPTVEMECNTTTELPSENKTATSKPSMEPTVAGEDNGSEPNSGFTKKLEECAVMMGVTAGIMFALAMILGCAFSFCIACLCHKHKMTNYKIKVKKHFQSKWDY